MEKDKSNTQKGDRAAKTIGGALTAIVLGGAIAYAACSRVKCDAPDMDLRFMGPTTTRDTRPANPSREYEQRINEAYEGTDREKLIEFYNSVRPNDLTEDQKETLRKVRADPEKYQRIYEGSKAHFKQIESWDKRTLADELYVGELSEFSENFKVGF